MDLPKLPLAPNGKIGWPWSVQDPPTPIAMEDLRSWPLISIITPSYNQAHFIEETIRSVILQGYPNLEYIVIDGGSDDGSVEIIQKYAPWITYWVSEKDRGQSHAINKGFARARGDIVAWLNSDDVLNEHSLSIVGRYFSENPGCHFLAGFSEMRNIEGKEVLWTVDTVPQNLTDLLEYSLGRYLAQPSVFFARSTFNDIALLDEQLHYAMDLDLWLRLAERHDLHVLPRMLSWIRVHENAKTFRDNLLVYTEVDAIVARYRSKLSPSKYRAICRASKRAKALACLRSAIKSPHKSRLLLRAIFEAIRYDGRILFSRPCLSAALRLVLPAASKR
jgi:glycosyltransferase involved in cell wall biosynthesis